MRETLNRSASRAFEFGPFRLQVDEQLLLRDGHRLSLQPKAFDLLVALLERRGQLVKKDELLDLIWPGTFVAEANLPYTISVIRKVLDDGEGGRRYIETVPKRGYRFIAEQPTQSTRRVPRIAVLPFANASADGETDYLTDGIVETLINTFARLSGLSVIARATVFAYKGTQTALAQIGDDLNVDALLTGKITLDGGVVVLQVELVDALSQDQLWGESYRRSIGDLAAVQQEIVQTVAGKLGIRLSGAETNLLRKHDTIDPVVATFYLKGLYFLRRGTEDAINRALHYFDRALATEPRHAPSYAGIAHAYIALADWYRAPQEVMPHARTAALRALEIDDACAEAHLSLGVVRYAYEWDFAGAARSYARALDLNPNDSEVHHFYGWYLFSIGQCEKAVAVLRRAQELDPLHVNAHANLAVVFYLAHDFEAALAECEAAIELDPNWFWSHQLMGLAYQGQGRNDEALAEIQRARELNDAPVVIAALGHILAANDRREEALQTLAELAAVSSQVFVEPYEIATVHAGLGDLDATLAWLEKAYHERSCMMAAWFKMDPRFDRLREHPRFRTLISRIGSPA